MQGVYVVAGLRELLAAGCLHAAEPSAPASRARAAPQARERSARRMRARAACPACAAQQPPSQPCCLRMGCFIDPHPETWPRARAAPQQFRYAECAGRVVGPDTWLFSGCVPRDDAMPAFADFAAFLAGRRAPAVVAAGGAAADGAALVDGRLTHFIVWNEARARNSSTAPQQPLSSSRWLPGSVRKAFWFAVSRRRLPHGQPAQSPEPRRDVDMHAPRAFPWCPAQAAARRRGRWRARLARPAGRRTLLAHV